MIRSIFKKTKTTTNKETTIMTDSTEKETSTMTEPTAIDWQAEQRKAAPNQWSVRDQLAAEQEKADQAKADIDEASVEYRKAIAADDEAAAMSALERQQAAERRLQIITDRMPIIEARLPAAQAKDAEAEIHAECERLQLLADQERDLWSEYQNAMQAAVDATLYLQKCSHDVETGLRSLRHRLSRIGAPVNHPDVVRHVTVERSPHVLTMHGTTLAHSSEQTLYGSGGE